MIFPAANVAFRLPRLHPKLEEENVSHRMYGKRKHMKTHLTRSKERPNAESSLSFKAMRSENVMPVNPWLCIRV